MRRARAAIAGVLLLAGCSAPLRPVAPPTAWEAGIETRVELMRIGAQSPVERGEKGGLELVVRLHAAPSARLMRVRLARATLEPCSGGAAMVRMQQAGSVVGPLPVQVGGDSTLVLGFRPTPEEALDGPAALDLAIDQDGRLVCVRTALGPAEQWERPQLAMEVELSVGAPLRTLGDLGTPWMVEDRLGILVGPVDVSAGARIGLAGSAVLVGPSAAATFYPFTAKPLALALQLSYASLFEMENDASATASLDTQLHECYQVTGVALQLDWLGAPRGSRVRLRGRDFNDWGVEVFEQLWIPTLHAERPTTVLGIGVVDRLAL